MTTSFPRTKASYSASWNIGPVTTTVHGSRLGGLPNYDGTQRLGATSVYNASMNYRIDPACHGDLHRRQFVRYQTVSRQHLDQLSVLRQPLVQPHWTSVFCRGKLQLRRKRR